MAKIQKRDWSLTKRQEEVLSEVREHKIKVVAKMFGFRTCHKFLDSNGKDSSSVIKILCKKKAVHYITVPGKIIDVVINPQFTLERKLPNCPVCSYSVPPERLVSERKHFDAHSIRCLRCLYTTETKSSMAEAELFWEAAHKAANVPKDDVSVEIQYDPFFFGDGD